ncbi:hypothetical protein OG689_38870 [Kitasatospora sp. NBC_00240]|nr:hypothetical protein [Kitasatospora sp. NBC_00240]MCX5215160.1 hypothetical protein [Kitasatospora sp. NBC_00240]
MSTKVELQERSTAAARAAAAAGPGVGRFRTPPAPPDKMPDEVPGR